MIEEFWRLYYGELVLVESAGIESAMVYAGNALRAWKDGPPQRAILGRLSAQFRSEFEALLANDSQ